MNQVLALNDVKSRDAILSNIVDRDEGFRMPPPEPGNRPRKVVKRKLHSKTILQEDDYVDALSEIIERDYFPDTDKLRKHLALLNAHDANDIATISALHREILTDQRRSHATPSSSSSRQKQSGGANDFGDSDDATSARVKGFTVDGFLEAYTSEDNDSFEKLHEKDLEKWRKARHWAYESTSTDEVDGDYERRPGMLMLYHMDGRVMTRQERGRLDALLELPESIGDDRSNNLDTWRFRVRNNFMFAPDLNSQIEVQTSEGAPTMSTICDVGAKSVLTLPGPDAFSEDAAKKRLRLAANRWVGSNNRQEKIIQRNNTSLRMRPEVPAFFSAPSGITPSPLEPPHTPSVQSDTMSESSAGDTPHGFRGATARKYKTISMTPSPMPGGGGVSPLMTWGLIGGTPLILDPSDRMGGDREDNLANLMSAGYGRSLLSSVSGTSDGSAGVMYQPPPVKRRELLAHDLSAKAKSRKAEAKSSNHRQSRSSGGGGSGSVNRGHNNNESVVTSKSSRHSQHRHQHLTPAALSLAARLSGGGVRVPSHDSFGSDALSQSYSTTSDKWGGAKISGSKHLRRKGDSSSSRHPHEGMRAASVSSSSQQHPLNTDNLLNL